MPEQSKLWTERRGVRLYLLLLLVSGLVRWLGPQPATPPNMRFASVRAVENGKPSSRVIRLAYQDTAPDSAVRPLVVLVHGSPGNSQVLEQLAAILAPDFRVIVPDLPGFGASTHRIPDYSFRAHAQYLIQLLDSIHAPTAHLIGFSMGGGVILSIADSAPERVASLVMLSAIGAQEYELTGSYRANHILHGAQLAALSTLRETVPHFGLLDRFPLNVEYARNFYDSDQRPLRSILERYRGPMLILHGSKDTLVPAAAAREHHRLVPGSELVALDDNHFMVFERPWLLAQPLKSFLKRVTCRPSS